MCRSVRELSIWRLENGGCWNAPCRSTIVRSIIVFVRGRPLSASILFSSIRATVQITLNICYLCKTAFTWKTDQSCGKRNDRYRSLPTVNLLADNRCIDNTESDRCSRNTTLKRYHLYVIVALVVKLPIVVTTYFSCFARFCFKTGDIFLKQAQKRTCLFLQEPWTELTIQI